MIEMSIASQSSSVSTNSVLANVQLLGSEPDHLTALVSHTHLMQTGQPAVGWLQAVS